MTPRSAILVHSVNQEVNQLVHMNQHGEPSRFYREICWFMVNQRMNQTRLVHLVHPLMK